LLLSTEPQARPVPGRMFMRRVACWNRTVSQPRSLYDWKTESTWEKWLGRIATWSDWVLAAEA